MTTTAIDPALRKQFQTLAATWLEESKFLSDTRRMAALDSYRKIIGLGPDVLPCIFEALRNQTDFWFIALEELTGANPVPKDVRGEIPLIAKAWLEWGAAHGYID